MATPIACVDVGSDANSLNCCYADDQTSSACQDSFHSPNNTLSTGCQNNTLGCISECGDQKLLYTSFVQDDGIGNGRGPITRFQACVNFPSIARYFALGQLSTNISTVVEKYINTSISDDQLQNITSSVTDCLSATCRNSRAKGFCYDDYCSPVKLLTNSSSPNITAINRCLGTLCSSGYKSLPFADSDIVGIGVYASYILQCIFIALLWIGFFLPSLWRMFKTKSIRSSGTDMESSKHKKRFIDLLNEFHKAQCFFSITLMIASFTQDIYDTNMLITFMLVPLATNGIIPVVLAYLFLVHYKKIHLGTTIYTLSTYVLASIVYWSLYAHVISTGPTSNRIAYQQFVYKLSEIPACGGYSALAVCPHQKPVGINEVARASKKIRALTPTIWTLSTIVLLALLGYQAYGYWHQDRHTAVNTDNSHSEKENPSPGQENQSPRIWRMAFLLMTAVMLACLGMQLSTLSISKSLNMMDAFDWSFGQIVAVMIWIPPILEYVYKEISTWWHQENNDQKKDEKRQDSEPKEA